MAQSIYAAQLHTIIIMSVPIVGGWADGDVLEIEPLGPDYTTTVGTDGEVVRNDVAQPLWRMTLHLMQNSENNGILYGIRKLGLAAKNGAEVSPSLIRNQLGTFNFASPQTFIEQPAGYKVGREVSTSDWQFLCVSPDVIGY